MNKILLPEYPGNNLLFHAVSHSNAVDAINLLESTPTLTQTRRPKSTARMSTGALPSTSPS